MAVISKVLVTAFFGGDKMPYLDLIFTFVLLSICAYTDTKERKIYNTVTIPMIPIGILNSLFLYGVYDGFVQNFWLIPCFVICYVLYRTHQIGGGDAKLILAVGALMGLEYTLTILFISFIIGWFYALFIFIKNKKGDLKEKQRIMIPLGSVMMVSFWIVGGMLVYILYL